MALSQAAVDMKPGSKNQMPGEELGPLLGRYPAVDERDLNGLAVAIVRDRDALGHVKSPPIPDFGASRIL